MTALQTLEAIQSAGGRVNLRGDQLIVGPPSLARQYSGDIHQHKPELLALLKNNTFPSPEGQTLDFATSLSSKPCAYREGSLGWYLCAHGWTEVYLGQLAHPYWRRGGGPSMTASEAWAITLAEMSRPTPASRKAVA